MASELKPCPFCGGNASTTNPKLMDEGRYWLASVACDTCDASIDGHQAWRGDGSLAVKEAIEKWNRRAAPQPDTVEPVAEYEWVSETRTREIYPLAEFDELPEGSGFLYAHPPAKPDTVAVEIAQTWRKCRRDFDACQKVIHLRGGFDPAYVNDALVSLKRMDEAVNCALLDQEKRQGE